MKRLKDTLRKVAMEYAMKVGELLGLEPEYWVGEDISVDCCCFGDVWFLTLEEMQIIIDHLPKWLERYGSKKAVAKEIANWLDWTIEDGYDPDRDQYRRHARINLLAWLTGMRPSDLKTTIDETIQDYRDIINALAYVGETSSHTLTIAQAIEVMQARLRELEDRKRTEGCG